MRNIKYGQKVQKVQHHIRHKMYTRGEVGLSSPREGAKIGKKGKKTGVKTPVFQLEKGSAAFSQTQNIFAAREWTRSQIDKGQKQKEKFARKGDIKLFVKHRFYE